MLNRPIETDTKGKRGSCAPQPPQRRRKPGSAKGQIWMASDFDETPEDLKDLTVASADSTVRKYGVKRIW